MRPLGRCRDAIRRSWWGMILAEHDTEPTELGSGLLKSAIGIWLILPRETLPMAGAFGRLGAGPEWLWGAIFLAIGLGHLSAVYDGARGWRRAASMTGFGIWFGLCALSFWTNPGSLGVPFFAVLGAGQAWVYLRLGQGEPA